MSQIGISTARKGGPFNVVGANVKARYEVEDGGRITIRPINRDDFQAAATAAQQSHDQDWHVISCREQAKAIYGELRKLDAERARTMLGGRHGRSIVVANK